MILTAQKLKDMEPFFEALKTGQLERKIQDGWEKADCISTEDNISNYRIKPLDTYRLGDIITDGHATTYMITGARVGSKTQQYLINGAWMTEEAVRKHFRKLL